MYIKIRVLTYDIENEDFLKAQYWFPCSKIDVEEEEQEGYTNINILTSLTRDESIIRLVAYIDSLELYVNGENCSIALSSYMYIHLGLMKENNIIIVGDISIDIDEFVSCTIPRKDPEKINLSIRIETESYEDIDEKIDIVVNDDNVKIETHTYSYCINQGTTISIDDYLSVYDLFKFLVKYIKMENFEFVHTKEEFYDAINEIFTYLFNDIFHPKYNRMNELAKETKRFNSDGVIIYYKSVIK